jgi:VWFA-related protein
VRNHLIIFLLVAFAAVVVAQQPQTQLPIFRSDVNAVVVDLRVVDRDGRFVRDLTAEDFSVTEDGQPQSITTLALVDIPIERAEPPRLGGEIVDSDVASNANSGGRLYIIVLDDVHTNPLRSVTVRALARQFIERNLGPTDRAALIATSGRRETILEFTGNKRRLLDAAEKFQGGFGPFGKDTVDNIRGNHSTFTYLKTLAAWLSGVDGRRKAILFISEGFTSAISVADAEAGADAGGGGGISVAPSDVGVDPGNSDKGTSVPNTDAPSSVLEKNVARMNEDTADLQEVVDAAARSNVSFYAIDPRGLPGAPASTVKPIPTLDGEGPFSGRQAGSQQILSVLANETGGFALIRSNDFARAFDRVVNENSSYYVLGYTSTNGSRDSKFRRIRVRANRPGVRVRARTGYVARSDKPQKPGSVPAGWTPGLVDLLQSPVEAQGLRLSVSAAPFRGDHGKASIAVVVEAEGRDQNVTASQKRLSGPLVVLIAAGDSSGRIKSSERGVTDTRSPATRDAIDQYGLRIVSRLALEPGHYTLRVVGEDGAGALSTRGSVQYDLDVPDFSKGALMISGVLLASNSVSPRTTTGTGRQWQGLLHDPPTTDRVFPSGTELSLFAEIYDNDKKSGHRIEVTTTVRTDFGEAVFGHRETLQDLTAGSASRYQQSIPLKDVKPGAYVLTIDVRSTATAARPVSRRIPFSIR